jgi:hypothetical protein
MGSNLYATWAVIYNDLATTTRLMTGLIAGVKIHRAFSASDSALICSGDQTLRNANIQVLSRFAYANQNGENALGLASRVRGESA